MKLLALSTDQLDKALAGGEYLVSFMSVGELQPVLQVSRSASQILMSMVLGIVSANKTVELEKV
jgi:hypothetical protein